MIEKAKQADLPQIVSIWTDISRNEFAHYIGKDNVEYFITSGELEKESQLLLKSTFALKKQEEIVGYVVVIEDLIELLVLRPDWQNALCGKALYQFALNHIKSNYNKVRVECFENNGRINSILKRLGFTFLGSYQDELGFMTNNI